MNNFQRFLSIAVIGCFFLPWIKFDSSVAGMKKALNSMTEMLGELAKDSKEVAKLKEQMALVNKMDGASGFDLATTNFGNIGGHPILFMVPALALFAAVANKKKGYIIYPLLCGFCIFVNATFTGNVETGIGKTLTWFSLLLAFGVGCFMPKAGDSEESTKEEPMDNDPSASETPSESEKSEEDSEENDPDDSSNKSDDESGKDNEEEGGKG